MTPKVVVLWPIRPHEVARIPIRNNCEMVLIEDWIPLYMLEPLTLGGCILLSVGAGELGGWIFLLVGAKKSGRLSFLLFGFGKHVECNLYTINNIFCGFIPFMFPR